MLGSRVLLEIVFKRVKSALPARIATHVQNGRQSFELRHISRVRQPRALAGSSVLKGVT
jgi:hypothetical protein